MFSGSWTLRAGTRVDTPILFFWGNPSAIDEPGNFPLVIRAKRQAQPIVEIWLGKRDLSAACLLNDDAAEHSPAEETCCLGDRITREHQGFDWCPLIFAKTYAPSVGFRGDTVQ